MHFVDAASLYEFVYPIPRISEAPTSIILCNFWRFIDVQIDFINKDAPVFEYKFMRL